eukprot:COSAG06_NODE_4977_length_3815_cov_2.324004_2_plen_116_part_00
MPRCRDNDLTVDVGLHPRLESAAVLHPEQPRSPLRLIAHEMLNGHRAISATAVPSPVRQEVGAIGGVLNHADMSAAVRDPNHRVRVLEGRAQPVVIAKLVCAKDNFGQQKSSQVE